MKIVIVYSAIFKNDEIKGYGEYFSKYSSFSLIIGYEYQICSKHHHIYYIGLDNMIMVCIERVKSYAQINIFTINGQLL